MKSLLLLFLFLGCSSFEESQLKGSAKNPETLQWEFEALSKALAGDPKNDLALTGLGWLKIEEQDFSSGIHYFNQALKLNKKNPRAYMGLGICYGNINQYEFAIQSLRQTLKIKPDWYYAHYELGKIYYNMGDKKNYFAQLDTLVARNPELAQVLIKIIYRKPDLS